MSRPFRAAVVGVGHLGKFHARIYREIPGVDLVAVVDPNETVGREIASKSRCAWFPDVEKLPADLDGVSIVVPTAAHAAMAVPFLERGVATLVEKPIAATLEEADRILAAAKRGGAVLAVGHVERFNPAIRAVREYAIEPRFIESHRLAEFKPRSLDIGVVMDLMIHDLDLVLHLVGSEIESIDAVGGAMVTDREDIASVRIRFRNGAAANLTASRVSLQPMRKMRVFSPSGYVSIDFGKSYALLVKKGPRFDELRRDLFKADGSLGMLDKMKLLLAGEDFIQKREPKMDEIEPLRAELEAFVDSARRRVPPPVTGEDGRRALAAAQMVLEQLSKWKW